MEKKNKSLEEREIAPKRQIIDAILLDWVQQRGSLYPFVLRIISASRSEIALKLI